jgi:phosphate transport system substrate-binding protein
MQHTTQQRGQLCHNCSYDANPFNAKHCIVCGHPLKVVVITPNRPQGEQRANWIFTVPQILAVAAIGISLLALGSGLYLAWKGSQKTPTVANTAGSFSSVQLYHSFQDVQNVPRGLFNYTGGVTFAVLNSQASDAISQSHPDYRLRYTEPRQGHPGTTEGVAMLLNSEISFAQASRPLNDREYSKAKDRGIRLVQIPVFIDGITPYTHQGIEILGLSRDQLQGIFLGKITNWKQVGGADLPIVAVSQDPGHVSMVNDVLGDRKKEGLGRNVQIARDVTTAFRKVAATPGGISFATASEVSKQQSIHPLGLARANSRQYVRAVLGQNQINYEAIRDASYPLTRRLFVVIRQDGTLDEQAGLAYANFLLSDEGQNLVEKAGFVPLR